MASIDFCGSLRVHQQQLKRQPMERIRVDIRRKFKDGIEVSEKFRDKRLQHDKENGSAEEYNLLQVYHCWSLKLNGFIGESREQVGSTGQKAGLEAENTNGGLAMAFSPCQHVARSEKVRWVLSRMGVSREENCPARGICLDPAGK
ncbi:Os03g0752450 [Oryza sativa Japonica Group]|uniref:Os03g0752450 protein n=4 Tax=Oryza TaxID=4527 RepID=A0A0N7KI24_ORYSJ|nr:Os03g0752450 [Oryza sativa Japonica Group]